MPGRAPVVRTIWRWKVIASGWTQRLREGPPAKNPVRVRTGFLRELNVTLGRVEHDNFRRRFARNRRDDYRTDSLWSLPGGIIGLLVLIAPAFLRVLAGIPRPRQFCSATIFCSGAREELPPGGKKAHCDCFHGEVRS